SRWRAMYGRNGRIRASSHRRTPGGAPRGPAPLVSSVAAGSFPTGTVSAVIGTPSAGSGGRIASEPAGFEKAVGRDFRPVFFAFCGFRGAGFSGPARKCHRGADGQQGKRGW